MRDVLFDEGLPEWVCGETLFGWCSRYHRLAGHRLDTVTCSRLFGQGRSGLLHDFPGGLNVFANRTNGRLGSACDIALGHTLLGYYLAFRGDPWRHGAVVHLSRGCCRDLKARLGVLATRMGAAHPLKMCEACNEESRRQGEMPTWRLDHQFPGVWVCAVHGTPLFFTDALLWSRPQWLLPDAVAPAALKLPPDLDAGLALRTAYASADLVQRTPREPLDPQRVAAAFWTGLQQRGLARGERLHPHACGEEYAGFLRGYAAWPEADAVCVGPAAALAGLRRILKGCSRRALHPLRYITAALWLFESWPAFLEVWKAASASPSTTTPSVLPAAAQRSRHSDEIRRTVIAAVENESQSARAAAIRAGVSTTTAVAWLRLAKVGTARRPKAVTERVRQAIRRELRLGRDKARIAARWGLSLVTVTRILLEDIDLRALRADHQHLQAQEGARVRWQRAVKKCHTKGTAAARRLAPAAYAWLYRHDRSWLLEHRPPVLKHVCDERVDWHERDRHFAGQLRSLMRQAQPTALRRRDLVRCIPGLAVKVRHLDRLPRTAALLARLK